VVIILTTVKAIGKDTPGKPKNDRMRNSKPRRMPVIRR